MRITTKGRYALRAVFALAEMGKSGEMVSIGSLAGAEDISSIFLEQIFFNLKKAGIVKSSRGPGGGFVFDRPLDSVTIRDVLDAAGEELTLQMCNRHESECVRLGDCITHKVLASVTDMVNDYLTGLTVQQVLDSGEFNPK